MHHAARAALASWPRLGLGTWRMGEDPARRRAEVEALALGLDLGLKLIDTAEMYGEGGAERVVAEALRGRRNEVLLVSKVLPQNASYEGTLRAAARSLSRLATDRLDLYLLHWPGPHPLAETYRAFERLVEQGKVLHYGVSNFDVDDLERSEAERGGGSVAANQVLYNLTRRGIERTVLPWCRERGVMVMAYSPLEQGRLLRKPALSEIATRHGVSSAQVALAWVLAQPGVMAIPKAAKLERADLEQLERAFPRPSADVSLEFL